MMLKIQHEENGLFSITKGDHEWFMSPNKKQHPWSGVCEEDVVWFFDKEGFLDLYSFSKRRLTKRLNIGTGIGYDGKKDVFSSDNVFTSYDNKSIVIVQKNGRSRRKLTMVEAHTGIVIAKHDDLPGGWRHPIYQQDNGMLIFPVAAMFDGTMPSKKTLFEGGEYKVGLMTVDPIKGVEELSIFPATVRTGFFHSPSPDGRYWLKSDPTVIPVHDFQIPITKKGLFGRKLATKRYYGLSVQLWEAFPLRFVRSLTVAWLDETEMPDEGMADFRRNNKGLPPLRGRFYTQLSEILKKAKLEPLDVLSDERITSETIDKLRMEEDGEFFQTVSNYREFFKRMGIARNYVLGWSDSQSFWVNTNRSFSCININGKISPRLYLQNAVQDAAKPPSLQNLANNTIDILPNSKAKISKHYGSVETQGVGQIDASRYDLTSPLKMLSNSDVQWSPLEDTSEDKERENRKKRALAHMKKRMTYSVPLASMAEPDCINAILALTDQFDQELPYRAYGSEIKIIFRLDKKKLSEKSFFTHVMKTCPNAVSALRALIIKYHACTGEWDFLYNYPSKEDERQFKDDLVYQQEFLITAVTALGLMDNGSMDVLKLYAERIDSSHQYSFCRETLWALTKKHGMTDEVLKLAIWVMLFRSGNSIEPGILWHKYGIKAALKSNMQLEKAVAMFREVSRTETDKKIKDIIVVDFFGPIIDILSDPDDEWDKLFFGFG